MFFLDQLGNFIQLHFKILAIQCQGTLKDVFFEKNATLEKLGCHSFRN